MTARIMAFKAGDSVLQQRVAELEKQAASQKAEELVGLALKDGKLSPAQKEWAVAYALSDPKGFAAFVEKAPQVVPMGELLGDGTMALKGGTLDEATMLVCKQLGLDPEDVKKYNLKEE